jgi:hypothetical protein
MTEPTIFVIYHKPWELFNLPSNYKKIQVGKNCKLERINNDFVPKTIDVNDKFFEQMNYYDNIGDNISEYAVFLSENSVLYWVWKNLKFKDDDYIGFCHYRRIINYPPNYKNYDIIYNNYFDGASLNTPVKVWINNYVNKDDYNFFIELQMKNNYFEDYEKFKLFEQDTFKNYCIRDIFMTKWKYFNIIMEKFYNFYIKYIIEGYVPKTVCIEMFIGYIIWDLNKSLNNTDELYYFHV